MAGHKNREIMKIEIDLMNGMSAEAQMSTVYKYIEDNSTEIKEEGFLGMWDYVRVIKETAKNTSIKVETEKFVPFHVSCIKTKGGIYKFRVRNA